MWKNNKFKGIGKISQIFKNLQWYGRWFDELVKRREKVENNKFEGIESDMERWLDELGENE